MKIVVVQFNIKRFHPPQNSKSDPASGYGTNVHTFNVVSAFYTIGDVPVSGDDLFVRWDVKGGFEKLLKKVFGTEMTRKRLGLARK